MGASLKVNHEEGEKEGCPYFRKASGSDEASAAVVESIQASLYDLG
jgi:hypothetical protein